jgi:hypothetical protein
LLRRELSTKFDFVFKVLIALGIFVTTVISAVLKTETAKLVNWPNVQAATVFVQNSAWIILPLLVLATAIITSLHKKLGRPLVWNVVHYLLDEYRQQVFGNDEAKNKEPDHYHRVTLFKHVWLRPTLRAIPWGGWMIPVERSGQTTKSGIARFRASANDPDHAQGVAGQAWACSRPVSVHGLPDINVPEPVEADCKKYAHEGLVSTKWVYRRKRDRKKGASNGRSFFGIPVEVDGKTWGAVVIDSRSPDEIAIEPLLDNPSYNFKLLGGALSKLLANR